MEIATFTAECPNGHTFASPALSDMSYGEFLYFDLAGKGARYFSSFDNPVWDFVAGVVDKELSVSEARKGTIIQQIIGKIADQASPEAGYLQNRICPQCQAKAKGLNTDVRTGVLEVATLSFQQFEGQSGFEKERMVSEFIRQVR